MSLMGPVLVVVRDALAQCGEQVSFAVDKDAVEALAADAPYPPFRVGVGSRSQLHRMRTIGTDVSG